MPRCWPVPILLMTTYICFLLSGCTTSEAPPTNRKVRVLQAQSQELFPTLMFPGRSRPAKSVNLSFRVSGQLMDLQALVGQEVIKGQILARIDPRDFQFQVNNIQGSLLQAEASLRFAESEYERFNNISQRDPGAVSEILVKQKKENVNNLTGQLKSTQATLDTAKRALDDTSLAAPFNSTVVATFVDNFEYVNAAQFIVRLVSSQEIEVLIDVPDRIIASIKDARNIHVQFDAVPGVRFPATIEEIGTEASQTTRTFPVTLVVVPPEGTYLFPGMTGTAFLEQAKAHAGHEKTFKLPVSALLSNNGKMSTVWVANPSTWKVSAKPVEIITLAHQYSIVTGLSNEDWVVVSGVNFLTDKQTISPLAVRIDESGEIFQLPNQPIADHMESIKP
jgi:RND family efflux transporter MFP subunit